ncbi:hypothetical protein C7J88_09575 [Staphylococcus muscae]|uniref:Phage protein n=1 Tax=Staphylococcus muscae TaxID=1294 RepID=A0A240BZZ3_9STAP|nr:hypothetical protein [Staphylococcus muscae]AVQ34399.1 hypothetical protein C7J88_09575 [Staphylococcus muscae]PNZ01013.1 hypothetical protein CD131_09670 [Staphylococcus muscae]GGA93397.1 hypothetical protein GCM10007183_17000 [Staphylococcus muscae]SNW00623.1 Uncharacterised protein [Staphylococcus muscae]
MRSNYGLLARYRLYDKEGYPALLVIPAKEHVRVLGYGPYYKQYDGVYSEKKLKHIKHKSNLYTVEELERFKI